LTIAAANLSVARDKSAPPSAATVRMAGFIKRSRRPFPQCGCVLLVDGMSIALTLA
jgi:hypothetical protein